MYSMKDIKEGEPIVSIFIIILDISQLKYLIILKLKHGMHDDVV